MTRFRGVARLPFLAAPFLAALGAGPSCGAPPASGPVEPGSGEPPGAFGAQGAPRYLALSALAGLVEERDEGDEGDEGEGGLRRVLLQGRRMELRGREVVRVEASGPRLGGGIRAPAWAPAGAGRYVFWSGREAFTADAFFGPLRPLPLLPGQALRAFPWLGGVGVATGRGVVLVGGSGAGLGPPALGPGSVARAAAASASVAVLLSPFGGARRTRDGGKSFEVIGSGFVALEREGAGLRLERASGEVVRVGPGGELGATGGGEGSEGRDDGLGDRILRALGERATVHAGAPVALAGATLARLDPSSGRMASRVEIDREIEAAGFAPEACAPFSQGGDLLLLCAGEEDAAVVRVEGELVVERRFARAAGSDARAPFVGTDGEALGALGACADAGASAPASGAPGAFCARAGSTRWVEHRLPAALASHLAAWAPRRDGGAVALVAGPSGPLEDAPAVEERGALRIVRVAAAAPPLFLGASFDRPDGSIFSRGLRVLPDGALEGWLPSTWGRPALSALRIDPEGAVVQPLGPGSFEALDAAGPFALGATAEGVFWETSSAGRRWIRVEPPPGEGRVEPIQCSLVGCRVGPFFRLGWSASPEGRAGFPAEGDRRPEPLPLVPAPDRGGPPPPLVRLACRFDAPPHHVQVPNGEGVGASAPSPRWGWRRLGGYGAAHLPGPTPGAPATSSAFALVVSPLDPAAAPRHATVPLAKLPPISPFHEVRFGPVLEPSGVVRLVAYGDDRACAAPLVAELGLTPFRGCAPEDSLGVMHGGRVLLYQASGELASFALPGFRGGPGQARGSAARERAGRILAAGEMVLGVGLRGEIPFVVAVDPGGSAMAAALLASTPAFEREEVLAPLGGVLPANDRRCAVEAGELRVALALPSERHVFDPGLPGIAAQTQPGSPGIAVLRWSAARACLEALDLPIRDDRFEGRYPAHEAPRRLVVRWGAGRGGGTLLTIGRGFEVTQRVACGGSR